jgi:hypothetical protein
MLKTCLGLPDITAPPHPTAPDRLLVRCLDACAGGVLAAKLFRFLPLASGTQRFMMFARLQPDDARFLL